MFLFNHSNNKVRRMAKNQEERNVESLLHKRSQSIFDENFLIVAALDFGTTFSGYAFSFKDDFKNDPLKINVNQAWNSGGPGHSLLSLKTPTCLLLNKFQEMIAFGYEAENDYAELVSAKEYHDYYYFTRFKMCLYQNKVNTILTCFLHLH